MTAEELWLAGLFAPPLLVALLGGLEVSTERIRAAAVVASAAMLLTAALLFFFPELAALRIPWPWGPQLFLGADLLRVSELSAPLCVLPASLWLVTLAVTPRARLDRGGLRRTALATAFGTLAFLTDSPGLLACCWIASSLLFLFGLTSPESKRTRRVVAFYLGSSTLLVCAGVALWELASAPEAKSVGLWLIIVAVLIRKGIFPFHAWIPEAFDRGRIGPVVLFSAPQLGTYVAVTLVVPHASPGMLRTVAVLSLVTAVYGAALAVFQRDARRACGYLFVSQSALVLAGLDCTTDEALAGALVLWISSALAFTGLARAVLALEARRGRLSLDRSHGGFEQMPLLAASFLVLGLACTGFPGTLGFAGHELLVNGAVRRFPLLGFLTVAASTFTGLAVLRMYFSLFCGSRGKTPELPLRRREAMVFGAIATLLVVSGLAPRAIVDSRLHASEALLERRSLPQERSDRAPGPPARLTPRASGSRSSDHEHERRPGN